MFDDTSRRQNELEYQLKTDADLSNEVPSDVYVTFIRTRNLGEVTESQKLATLLKVPERVNPMAALALHGG